MLAALLVASFVELVGPGGQRIWVNPAQITNIREPRSEQHFAPGTKCLLFTIDGFLSVAEPCADVRRKLGQ